MLAFYAPTVNSYKRFASESWAPTQFAWSRDNRTTGFRVVGSGNSLRIECRIPGADVNPYLAFAASIASGMDGIRNSIDPPEEYSGNAYKSTTVLPRRLGDAADTLADSEFAKQAFGEDVVEHYAHFYRTEAKAYETSVTDWERKRYFEMI